MRDALPVIMITTFLGFCAYIGSYAVLAYPSNSCNPWYPSASYRINQSGGREVAYLYFPLHLMDRQLRPDYWKPTPPISFSGPDDESPKVSELEQIQKANAEDRK